MYILLSVLTFLNLPGGCNQPTLLHHPETQFLHSIANCYNWQETSFYVRYSKNIRNVTKVLWNMWKIIKLSSWKKWIDIIYWTLNIVKKGIFRISSKSINVSKRKKDNLSVFAIYDVFYWNQNNHEYTILLHTFFKERFFGFQHP